MPISSRLGPCQSSVARSMRRVREALVTSVACTDERTPPVRFQSSQESIVPKASSPLCARSRAPSTWSSIHAIFGPEK